MASGYVRDKQDLLVRLRRIEGQVRGLHRQVRSFIDWQRRYWFCCGP